MYVIYALVDPRNNTVRYVGQTSSIRERFIAHLRCNDGRERKIDWIMDLATQGYVPTIQPLEIAEDYYLALEQETKWIMHFRKKGCDLFNSDGSQFRTAKQRHQQAQDEKHPDLPVSKEKLNLIAMMLKAGYARRDIAKLVKMEGRNYNKFKAACAYLGINQAAAN